MSCLEWNETTKVSLKSISPDIIEACIRFRVPVVLYRTFGGFEHTWWLRVRLATEEIDLHQVGVECSDELTGRDLELWDILYYLFHPEFAYFNRLAVDTELAHNRLERYGEELRQRHPALIVRVTSEFPAGLKETEA